MPEITKLGGLMHEITKIVEIDPAEDTEDRLAYLSSYHEITQSMIGLMKMDMTPEQRAKYKTWDDQLDVLFINRLLAIGVPYDRLTMFNGYTLEEVAKLGIARP
jgi:hypothetical protein